MNELIIRTAERGWLSKVAAAYKARSPMIIVDDANVGIDPSEDTILAMGKKAKLEVQEWVAVGVALGIATAGAYLLVMAILDPEPFSKMAFAIGSGSILVLGGGFAAIRILTNHKPPNVRVTPRGFEVQWE